MNFKLDPIMKTALSITLVLMALGSTGSVHAQGSAFTYQGRLEDGGLPASGLYDLQFSLWNADSNGGQIGSTVTTNPVTASNGIFTVSLDFGDGAFDGSGRWLEIGVRTSGSAGAYSVLNPRQPLLPAPYAIKAGDAMTVAGSGITGTIGLAQLPATVVTNGATGVNISGTFSGNGAGITNVGFGTLNSGGAITWGNFNLSSSPGVGGPAYSVAAADVNGDGKVDLISANGGSNTLSVLTNNGSGGFGLSSSPGVGTQTRSVTAADINGDGRVDLISANFSASTLSVLTNNGSGGFGLSSSPGVGSGPLAVTATDVNGDGKVDLISANFSASTLSVLTNNGSGGFVLSSSPGVGAGPYSITAADFNGDGKVDLSSANQNANTLSVLTNNGSGGFVLSSSPGVGLLPQSVTAAEVNGDGWVDLISANGSANTLSVLINNGSGGFGLSSSPGVGEFPASVTAADVNGDGKVDLISGNLGGALSVLFNKLSFNGDGSGLTGLTGTQITDGTITASDLSSGVGVWSVANVTNIYRASGNVGIGTPSPANKLTVSGNVDVTGSLGIGTNSPATKLTVNAAGFGIEHTDGTRRLSTYLDTSGARIGTVSAHPLHFNTANSSPQMTLTTTGRLGIGTINPLSRLDVDGDARVSGELHVGIMLFGDWANVQWGNGLLYYDNSSRRFKENIKPLEDDFELLLQAESKTYTRPDRPDRWEIGFIAEEFDEIGLKKLVDYEADGTTPMGINYEKICLYLTEIAKGQRNEIESLKSKSAALQEAFEQRETEMTELKQRLAALEQLVGRQSASRASTRE